MGAVYKRKTRKGTVRWLGRYRDSQKKEHSRSFDTRREAVAWINLMENKGTAPDSGDSVSTTVKDIWEEWTNRDDLSSGSVKVYEWTSRNLLPIEELTINELSKTVLDRLYGDIISGRAWISPEDEGVSVENAKATLGRLRSAITHYSSLHEGIEVPESVRSWKAPKKGAGSKKRIDPSALPTIYDLRTVGKIFREGGKKTSIAAGMRPSPSLAAAIEVCAVTGLRIGELVGLDVDSVDSTRSSIIVRHQLTVDSIKPSTLKTPSSRRTVPVPNETMILLGNLVKEASTRPIPEGWESQPLFLNQRGVPWKPAGALFALKKAQWIVKSTGRQGRKYNSKSEIPIWGWHSIRHLYASTLLAEGRPITEVAAVLGHSSPTTTAEIYSHALHGYETSVRKAAGSMVLTKRSTYEDYAGRYGE